MSQRPTSFDVKARRTGPVQPARRANSPSSLETLGLTHIIFPQGQRRGESEESVAQAQPNVDLARYSSE
ncbi:hypothetical protein B0H17DRAFT_1054576 [Mycena rosella]|uniref:Uncharacterized protein n=1 Tax=Mycena rosella TaxID=1033263 RepID=A0AAD7DNH9_MYCRO|nr:hypothetical protein B0H17DRAFT_1054576 [Mycena rosella]